jgi:hypothetical protein
LRWPRVSSAFALPSNSIASVREIERSDRSLYHDLVRVSRRRRKSTPAR